MPPRRREGGDICAIYVHAGAGFHSYQNEKAHLQTCHDAAKIAMAVLRNGGSAIDAVEIAIKLMEDREITNAGYGSNLTTDGAVECDATIIDHQGRSGAVGAVSQVKNPISLARVLLDSSSKPLSLHRVPPNLLVGPGATDFAYDNGISVLPPDFLISPAGRERWLRWRHDLDVAHQKEIAKQELNMNADHPRDIYASPIHHPATILPAHLMSPPSSVDPKPHGVLTFDESTMEDSPAALIGDGSNSMRDRSPRRQAGEVRSIGRSAGRQRGVSTVLNRSNRIIHQPRDHSLAGSSRQDVYTHVETLSSRMSIHTLDKEASFEHEHSTGKDYITDTVGAIAVDCFGNIAAGSSSGGIGMKHRGRVGPAALVGVGTSVIPIDPHDPEKTCVATVTSGTGEHMATTLAASTCASRIYFSQRRGDGGVLEEVSEDEALKAMIELDFMGHPGVKDSHCEGAIGVMAVKKTKDGVFLFFGHNTDSFALASMSSEDRRPSCVMSRSHKHGSVAQGGRVSRYGRYRAINIDA